MSRDIPKFWPEQYSWSQCKSRTKTISKIRNSSRITNNVLNIIHDSQQFWSNVVLSSGDWCPSLWLMSNTIHFVYSYIDFLTNNRFPIRNSKKSVSRLKVKYDRWLVLILLKIWCAISQTPVTDYRSVSELRIIIYSSVLWAAETRKTASHTTCTRTYLRLNARTIQIHTWWIMNAYYFFANHSLKSIWYFHVMSSFDINWSYTTIATAYFFIKSYWFILTI